MNRNWLKFLLGLSAILVAGCAAYFSVTGLGVLFSGASVAVMIMAGSLEFAKLVSATYLKQRWKEIKGLNKWYLTIAVIILMIITSAGIFGFLSNAFQQQNIRLEQVQREISVWDTKIKSDSQQIASLTVQLNNLQANQGKILENGKVNNRLLRSVDNRDKQSGKLQDKINSLQDSSIVYNGKINDIKNKNIDLEREIGGFRFVAESFNLPLNSVVKFFIIMIVFVFDPLAIALVIAFNQVVVLKRKEEPKEEDPIDASDLVAEVSRVRLTEDELQKLEERLIKKDKQNKTNNQDNTDGSINKNNNYKEKDKGGDGVDAKNGKERQKRFNQDDTQGPPINPNIQSPHYDGDTKEGSDKKNPTINPNIQSPNYEGGDEHKKEPVINVQNPEQNNVSDNTQQPEVVNNEHKPTPEVVETPTPIPTPSEQIIEPTQSPENASEMMVTTNEDIIESIPLDDEVSNWDLPEETYEPTIEEETENISTIEPSEGPEGEEFSTITPEMENIFHYDEQIVISEEEEKKK
jgi:hypothetical protein